MERLRIILFGLITFFILCVVGEKIDDLENEVEGLENLVEYHQQRNVILMDENWTLKSQLEKQVNQ